MMGGVLVTKRIIGNLQGQEAAYACPAYSTTGELFTGANAVKFVSVITYSSCLEHYCLVIIELVHSYHVESVNLR